MTVILASSTVNVAFPDIMGLSDRARSGATPIHRLLWCHDRRHAAFGLGDPEFRQRAAFIGALLLFLGSAMSGLATNTTLLSSGRVFKGPLRASFNHWRWR